MPREAAIVRENCEREYSEQGGAPRGPWPGEVGGSLPLYAGGRDPDQWFAFALALSNPRKLLTLVTKSNAQRHGVVMWGDRRLSAIPCFDIVERNIVDSVKMA